MTEKQPLLEVSHLKKYFPIRSSSIFKKPDAWVKAVDDVSFYVDSGETLGIVGESGWGGKDYAGQYDLGSGKGHRGQGRLPGR